MKINGFRVLKKSSIPVDRTKMRYLCELGSINTSFFCIFDKFMHSKTAFFTKIATIGVCFGQCLPTFQSLINKGVRSCAFPIKNPLCTGLFLLEWNFYLIVEKVRTFCTNFYVIILRGLPETIVHTQDAIPLGFPLLRYVP